MALSARWKGQAIYYNLVTDTRIAPKEAWSYLNPSAGFEPIAGGCCGRGAVADQYRVTGTFASTLSR